MKCHKTSNIFLKFLPFLDILSSNVILMSFHIQHYQRYNKTSFEWLQTWLSNWLQTLDTQALNCIKSDNVVMSGHMLDQMIDYIYSKTFSSLLIRETTKTLIRKTFWLTQKKSINWLNSPSNDWKEGIKNCELYLLIK